MIKILTKRDIYEIRATGQSMVLYQSGVCRGKIIFSRNIEVGEFGLFECQEEGNNKGSKFWTTGGIEKIVEE